MSVQLDGYFAALVAFNVIFWPTFILFLKRRHLQPIKARQPRMVAVTGVAIIVMFFRVCVGNMVGGQSPHSGWCTLFKWMNNLSYALFMLPYAFRCGILHYIFRKNVETMAIGTLIPVHAAAADASGYGNGEEDDVRQREDVHMIDPVRPSHVHGKRPHDVQLHSPTSSAHGEHGMLVTANERSQEGWWLRVLVVVMLPFLVLSIVETALGPSFSPTDVNGCSASDHHARWGEVFWLCVHVVETAVFTGLWAVLRHVRDEFSIKRELIFFIVMQFAFDVTLITLLIYTLKGFDVKSFYHSAVSLLLIIRAAIMYGVSVLHPLYRTWVSPPVILWPSLESLTSLDKLLTDTFCLQYFRAFLAHEFTVSSLLLYMDITLFEDEYDPHQSRLYARSIFEQYIKADGIFHTELSPSTVRDIHIWMGDPKSSMFNVAKREVYARMENDSFPRFLRSDMCRELVAQLTHEQNIRARLLASRFL